MSGRLDGTAAVVAMLVLSIPAFAQAPGDTNRMSGNGKTEVRIVSARVNLEIVDGVSRQDKRLAVLKGGKELGSIAVPPRISAAALDGGLKGILRHPNGNDLAVGFGGDEGSFVVVFLLQASGAYLAVDLSRVEQVNIGVIGPDRTYRDVQTAPIEWLTRPDGDDAVQVRLQTRARDLSGRRYFPTEPLIITRDGWALWR